MGLPMPLYERFAPGTTWRLAVPYGTIPVGTIVKVEGPLQHMAYEDEILVACSLPDEQVVDIPVDILA